MQMQARATVHGSSPPACHIGIVDVRDKAPDRTTKYTHIGASASAPDEAAASCACAARPFGACAHKGLYCIPRRPIL